MTRFLYIVFLVLVSLTSVAQKGKKKKEANLDPMDVTQLSESESLKVETLLIDAQRELILENSEAGLELLEEALKIYPDNATINFKIAEVLATNGDHQQALKYAMAAAKLDPTNQYYLILAAEINKSLSNLEEAAAIYQRMIDEIPGTETYLFDLAIIYQYQGNFEKALEIYERAEAFFGINEFVLREKQKIYLKNKDYESLIRDWDRLIAEHPGDNRYVIELCEFLIMHRQFDEAEKRLKNLTRNKRAELLLSEIALSKGNLSEAMQMAKSTLKSPDVDYSDKVKLLHKFLGVALNTEDFKTIMELAVDLSVQYPDLFEVQAFVGDVMFRLEEPEEALKYYLNAIAISPSIFSVWQNILNIEANQNDYAAVVKYAEEALEYFPNQALFYYFAGTGHLIEKNYKKSVQYLERGKKFATDPNLLTVFNGQLGDAFNSMKEYDKSYKAYEEALESDPENDHVLNNYSYYLSLRKKELSKALGMSSKLVSLHPDNPTYLDTHGWVLYTMGKYSEALPFLKKAADLDEDGTVIEHYGDVLYQLNQVEEALIEWKRAKAAGGTSENIDKKIADKKLYE